MKSRKKRSSWDSAAFNPKRPNQQHTRKPKANVNVLAMRADTKMQNDDKPVKVIVVVHEDKITAKLDPNFTENLAKEFAKVPGNRPGKVTKKSAITDSPLEAETPGGSVLHRKSRLGILSFLSNQPSDSLIDLQLQESIINKEFYNSPQYKAITEVVDHYKKQSTVVKSESRTKHVAETYKKNNKTIMGVAATEYVQSTRSSEENIKLFNDHIKCEWLHLVARMFDPLLGQDSGDIVAGTYHANTEMVLVEQQMKFLASKYPEGVLLEVFADLIPDTHIAKKIHFKVTTKDFSLPFEFNAQTTIQPHITYQSYIRNLFEELVKQAENKEAPSATPFKAPTSSKSEQKTPTLFKKSSAKKNTASVEETHENSKKLK